MGLAGRLTAIAPWAPRPACPSNEGQEGEEDQRAKYLEAFCRSEMCIASAQHDQGEERYAISCETGNQKGQRTANFDDAND